MYLMRIKELLIVACMIYTGGCTIVNDYRGRLHFECAGGNQFISHVSSVRSNHREDRVFNMSCRNLPVNVTGLTPSCYWTRYLNDWDAQMIFHGPGNRYISGFHSYFNIYHGDRRWKVKSCNMNGIYFLAGCNHTPWTNGWNGKQNFIADSNRVMTGIISTHNNYREDRRYKFVTCEPIRV
ncbi:hemagglutinin/amebocyte aggregation factor-like isoform X2 [Ruditapes philippinarum]|uniref:hemagglutinin/amebocyte aggregation factor-like isoform X2 n=1 Tax=Ruditapes philippinarum TaxID=129788 RepID=UPI00295B3CE2|nr:hemagglutinin/amebocyte aggregation factor-like isoform X2 [Ruditapes philippinarum]